MKDSMKDGARQTGKAKHNGSFYKENKEKN